MTKIGLIPGRQNPPHRGHRTLYRKSLAENDMTYVVIIQGKITALDKVRNPLNFKQKKKIIQSIEPQVEVQQFPAHGSSRVPSADVPGMIVEILTNLFMDEDDFLFTVYCGSDQAEMYKRQAKNPAYIQKIKDELRAPDLNIRIRVKVLERDESAKGEASYSATRVRDAIRAGKDKLAMKMMGITDEDFYEEIKAAVLAGVQKEAVETTINQILEKL